MSYDHDTSPLNPLPAVVVILVLVIAGIEILFQLGNSGLIGGVEATGWRITAIEEYGFRQPLFAWMLETGQFRWDFAVGILTYPFVDYYFTSVLFSIVFILALGKMVGEAFSSLAFLAIFFSASIMGALVYGLVWETNIVLFGAMTGAYGLIGGYSFVLWVGLTGKGLQRMKAFQLIGFLMALQLFWGLAFSGSKDWVANLTGFATGFALSFLVCPGGWQHLMGKLRSRP